MRTDRLDLYLLHWPGRVPLAETVDAFERLRAAGKIVRWGVSNFDIARMRQLVALPEGGRCAVNQVLYHLGERGIEWDLLPWMREQGMPVMAYSPLGQATLLRNRRLVEIAAEMKASPAQVALSWLLRATDVIAIPASTDPAHLRANRAAAELALDAHVSASLDAAFPPPGGRSPLSML